MALLLVDGGEVDLDIARGAAAATGLVLGQPYAEAYATGHNDSNTGPEPPFRGDASLLFSAEVDGGEDRVVRIENRR